MGNNKDLEDWRKEYEGPEMSARQLEQMKAKMEEAKTANRKTVRLKRTVMRGVLTAAACAAVFVTLPNISMKAARAMEQIPLLGGLAELVTLRNYQYEDEHHMADIEMPQIVPEDTDETKQGNADGAQDNLKKTTEEINREMRQISEKFVREFKESLSDKKSMQDAVVKYKIVGTTENYFTIKLNCYQAEASSAEWNYYYTIDRGTGKRLHLKDLFEEEADYIKIISENIKAQMREQMKKGEDKIYWLDDEEMEEDNFQQITDDTAFYLNKKGNIVISFNEGDVAPMYMGVVTFEIPHEAVADSLKNIWQGGR